MWNHLKLTNNNNNTKTNLEKINSLRNMINDLKEIIYKRILDSQNFETFMMNNLQKDL